MKIAVLSDTHIKNNNINILKEFLKNLPKVDMIVHSGDLICYEAYELMKNFSIITAVQGNVDDETCKIKLNEKEILEVMNYKIGIFHGHGNNGSTLDRVKNVFKEDNLDIIVFGHSHKPAIFTEKNTIYINPGSPFYKRKEKYFTYILLHLEVDNISASLMFIK
jgi:putative phosphoesterase